MSLILTNDNVTFKIQSPRVTYSTVSDMQNVAVPTEGDCVTVTDEGQGGTFIYRVSNAAINNGGTIFNGWTREYSGAVNVKWFGGGAGTDITLSLETALLNHNSIIIDIDCTISSISLTAGKQLYIDSEIGGTGTVIMSLTGYGIRVEFGPRGKLYGDNNNTQQSGISLNNCIDCEVLYPFIDLCKNKGVVITGGSSSNLILKPRVRGANGTTGAGIALHGTNVNYNSVIEANVSNNRVGLTINGGQYNMIDHPVANTCSASGVSIDGIITGSGDGGKYNTIISPICHGNGSTSYGGIFCGNGSDFNSIISPVCNNNAGAGIRFSGGAGYQNKNNNIDNPICNGNGSNGITLSWCNDILITNPTIDGNTGRGISDSGCDGVKIVGGTVTNNTTDGILHQSIRTLDRDVTVSSNTQEGIQIAYGGGLGLGNNRTEGCHIVDNLGVDYQPAGASKAINCTGFVTNSSGVDIKMNGQTISHDLSGTPLRVTATGSVAGEIVTVYAFAAGTFSVNIMKSDGVTAGTSQAIYWESSLY